MNEMRKLMEAVQLDEYERSEPIYIEYRDPDGDFVVKYRASRGYYAEGPDVDRAQSFENIDDAIEHGELCISSGLGDEIEGWDDDHDGNPYGDDRHNERGTGEIEEDYFGNAPDVRKATNKLHELMDEQILDPRSVADAALKYMSESDVADMARINELIYEEEDELEEEIKGGIPGGRPFIDLSGPGGNAFAIMGQAKDYAKQLGLDGEAIVAEMQESDYENLLSVFDKYFGEYVDLYRGDNG